MYLYLPLGRIKPHDPVGNADLPMSGQASDPEDLTLLYLEGHVPGNLARHADPKMVKLQADFLIFLLMAHLTVQYLNLAAHHKLRHLNRAQVSRVVIPHHLAVPEDKHMMGVILHLIQFVADEDKSNPALGHGADTGQELLCFCFRKHCGGFVQHDQLGILFIQLAGNFHKLLISHRKASHPCPVAEFDSQGIQGGP